jgi:hypothetical protein
VRFRRTRGVERQQLKWFTYAAVLSVLAWLFFALTGLQEQLPSALEYMVGAIFLAGVPVAIGIALLRYHLYDIDRLIRRTLVRGAQRPARRGLRRHSAPAGTAVWWDRRGAAELGGSRGHLGRGGAVRAGTAPRPAGGGSAFQPAPL